jgi:hypothetical protein
LTFFFEPPHERFDFTLEGRDDDESLNSHNDLPQCTPNDSVLERDLSRERVFINPPKELAGHIGRHFEKLKLKWFTTNRQSGPAAIYRPSILSHTRLTSKFRPGFFDRVHLSTHLASLLVDIPRELENCKQSQQLLQPARLSNNSVKIVIKKI